ncbi:methyltransferase [Yinghuangia soli]|uniref:Methyltransferase domain-containing protein n=1 Tax=Yinghuangia soli TaxID=2908204 RepID=A0AA41Q408_9ACTN|nr:methyltransferase [Yinghuangia soli]MCF2530812.1 methyltransferase domain-containing protein [Yinghuangia soli]
MQHEPHPQNPAPASAPADQHNHASPTPAPGHTHGPTPGHGQHQHAHGHAHAHGHTHGQGLDHDIAGAFDAELAVMLDLDAEVLHDHLADVTRWVAAHTGDALPVRRIADVGCGTGTGTFALLPLFPKADAVAVDKSAQLLEHLAGKARTLGVADRVTPLEADLDADAWPALGPVELVWASASLHHMADPDRALREMFAALRPGGLLALAELDGFPLFLPDGVGAGLDGSGIEARSRAALQSRYADHVPHLGADWAPHLERAGFAIEAERVFAVDLHAPLPPAAGRYAQAMLRRMRTALADPAHGNAADGAAGDGTGDGTGEAAGTSLSADDLALLDRLVADDGPESVLHRGDLNVRTERIVWLARRPAA